MTKGRLIKDIKQVLEDHSIISKPFKASVAVVKAKKWPPFRWHANHLMSYGAVLYHKRGTELRPKTQAEVEKLLNIPHGTIGPGLGTLADEGFLIHEGTKFRKGPREPWE